MNEITFAKGNKYQKVNILKIVTQYSYCSSTCHFYLVGSGNNIGQTCSHSTNICLTFSISDPILGTAWVFKQARVWERNRKRQYGKLTSPKCSRVKIKSKCNIIYFVIFLILTGITWIYTIVILNPRYVLEVLGSF